MQTDWHTHVYRTVVQKAPIRAFAICCVPFIPCTVFFPLVPPRTKNTWDPLTEVSRKFVWKTFQCQLNSIKTKVVLVLTNSRSTLWGHNPWSLHSVTVRFANRKKGVLRRQYHNFWQKFQNIPTSLSTEAAEMFLPLLRVCYKCRTSRHQRRFRCFDRHLFTSLAPLEEASITNNKLPPPRSQHNKQQQTHTPEKPA